MNDLLNSLHPDGAAGVAAFASILAEFWPDETPDAPYVWPVE